jgi:hypothetical protein
MNITANECYCITAVWTVNVDCIDCMLKIVPSTAIHIEANTLGDITFAKHLGILLKLRSYDCALTSKPYILEDLTSMLYTMY